MYCLAPRAVRADTDPGVVAASTEDIAAVRAELARQSAELARQNAELARQNAELSRQRAALSAAAEDERWQPKISGYLQVDWVLHNQASQDEINGSTSAPLNRDRFTLRRGHLRVSAERRFLSGALEIDANTTNGAQLRPIDAEIAVHWPDEAGAAFGPPSRSPPLPRFTLSAGLMKIPFGFEVPELDWARPFLERSTMARAFFPGDYDLGARFRTQYRFLDLGIAAMNGHPIGDRVFPALAPNQKKEIIGHLEVHGEIVPGLALAVGVSADTGRGFHPGTPTSKDQLQWRDDNGDGIVQATEVQVIAGSSASASQQFHRFALGADARMVFQFAPHAAFEVRAEVVRASNLDRGLETADPVGAGHDLHEFGWYLGGTQEITRFALIGVRYDHYDPDQDAREQQAADVVARDRGYGTLAFLGMLRYEGARLSLEYDRNGNALGRDASGAPTTLASDALTLRGQWRF